MGASAGFVPADRPAVIWPDEVDEVIGGDLTAALAYLTPAGGAAVTGVAPLGLRDRERGMLSFTTSLGFPKKLERLVRDPAVALAFHTREHGRSTSPAFVLVQGRASVTLEPSPWRGWRRSCRSPSRSWARSSGARAGTGCCASTVVPVGIGGHDDAGVRLVTPAGLLPPGGRRAGLLAHRYRPRLVGLSTRGFTGWLDVTADGVAVYAPHTSRGFVAPPRKELLLVSHGPVAKLGVRKARRGQVAERLGRLAQGGGSPAG